MHIGKYYQNCRHAFANNYSTLGNNLEVKYNQVLPPYIAIILSFALRDGAVRSAISKYVYCRRFEFKDF